MNTHTHAHAHRDKRAVDTCSVVGLDYILHASLSLTVIESHIQFRGQRSQFGQILQVSDGHDCGPFGGFPFSAVFQTHESLETKGWESGDLLLPYGN